MAGRVSRAPGEDEVQLQQALAAIKEDILAEALADSAA
jgi:hypothetical protein